MCNEKVPMDDIQFDYKSQRNIIILTQQYIKFVNIKVHVHMYSCTWRNSCISILNE